MININLSKLEKQNVYSPNDDSYLFQEVLIEEANQHQQLSSIVEVGCGTGILIGSLIHELNKQNKSPLISLAIDINYDACIVSQKTFDNNQIKCEIINTNGLQGLNKKFKFDVAIFNPPYVPTEPDELQNHLNYFKEKQQLFKKLIDEKVDGEQFIEQIQKVNLIDVSYSGGKDGMYMTWNIIDQLIAVMSNQGIMYLFHINKDIYLLFKIILSRILLNI
ncbi:hypothetical protein pb186bvf_003661 [Paramecium bursaria]